MSTYRVMLTAVSVQSAKPSYAYGSLSRIPVKSGAAHMLLRAPVSLPRGATITSAVIYVNQDDPSTEGSWGLTVRRNYTAWPSGVTWNTKPAVTDVTHALAKTNPPTGTWWAIDVTSDVQGFVAGTKANYGWRLSSTSSTQHFWRGQSAINRQPYLQVTYELTPKTPTNLAPAGGAVAIDKPVLTFTTGDNTTAIQVQIDPGSDSVSPDFDSGEVAAAGGVLDLADTAYAGLADGDTTYWRARAKSSLGWSAWSPWVDFSRDDPDAVTLLAPTTTPADTSPPFLWSFAGTQATWQATLMDANSKVLDDSGVVAGADTSWTPSRGLSATGQSGIARIRVWDDVVRIATPGVAVYSEDIVEFTADYDGTVDPMDTLVAALVDGRPGVELSGTRAAGIPDEVAVIRDGVQVDRFPGTDIFTTATDFSFTDWSAPLNRPTTYRLAPVVNGAVASGGPTVTVTPRAKGLWLIDPDTDLAVVLWGASEGSFDAADIAAVHVPVADGATVVRRRLKRGVLSGTESGLLVDDEFGAFPVDDMIANLETFRDNDAGHVYQLVDGHASLRVIVGDITVFPTPDTTPEVRQAKAQFNFWSV